MNVIERIEPTLETVAPGDRLGPNEYELVAGAYPDYFDASAIDYVNARPRPLALYYFGDDDADRRKVLDRTTSGNVVSFSSIGGGTPSRSRNGLSSSSISAGSRVRYGR